MQKAHQFFATRPVFTYEEFAELLATGEERSPRTADSLLAYHTRMGHLLRIRRGLYASVPPGANPETCPVDPYLVAAKMSDDVVLAYHTALEFHGKAYSVHHRFFYLTHRVSRPLTFRGHNFRGVPFPKALRDKQQEFFGVQEVDRGGLGVRVTGLERTLVDALDRPELSGGWEEVWRSLELVEFFDLDRVVDYALFLENATTAAKVGFFLEQNRERLMVDEDHLERLRAAQPQSPHYLERGSRQPHRLVPGWNLVVPQYLFERSWGEVA